MSEQSKTAHFVQGQQRCLCLKVTCSAF